MSSGSQSVVGKSAALRSEWSGSVGAFCAIVRPDRDQIDPRYLALYMRSEAFRSWTRTSEGVNIKNIRHSDLLRHRLPVPSLSEQRRIADLLSRAENIVRMRREADAKTKEIIPALFVGMFGDPGVVAQGIPGEGRREAPSAPKLGDLILSAEYGTSTKAKDEPPGIPMIRMGNVDSSGRTRLGDIKYIELSGASAIRYGLRSGDILFNRTNSKELVGKTGIWRGECDAVAASYFIRMRVDQSKVTPDYVWAFMNTRHMKRVLFGMARGAIGQSNINAKELRAIAIPLPALSAQRSFSKHVETSLSLEKQQSEATAQAERAFRSLLAGVFEGG
jgi:type I restriction enzyme S subunit